MRLRQLAGGPSHSASARLWQERALRVRDVRQRTSGLTTHGQAALATAKCEEKHKPSGCVAFAMALEIFC